MSSSVSSGGSTPGGTQLAAHESRLAHAAASGDGAAFATLYDSYERRIFNYCHRLLGSAHDAADATQEAFLNVLQRLPKLAGRELNFSAYLFTAARNASYDMIGQRKQATPVDAVPEPGGDAREPGDLELDPERTALLASTQDEVRAANGRLPDRQREVLALRELEEMSYGEIAVIMEMNENAVAQLISRARINLRDELRGSALAAVAASSPECERALPLIAMREDGQLPEGDERQWLDAHLASCESCRLSKEAMEEAGASYRAWLPIVPLAWLRDQTIAKAAELVGADWSAHAGQATGQATTVIGGAGRRWVRRLAWASLAVVVLVVAVLLMSGDLSEEPASVGVTGATGPSASQAGGATSATRAPGTPRSGSGTTGGGETGSQQLPDDEPEGGDQSGEESPSPTPETPPDEGQAPAPDETESTPPSDHKSKPPDEGYY